MQIIYLFLQGIPAQAAPAPAPAPAQAQPAQPSQGAPAQAQPARPSGNLFQQAGNASIPLNYFFFKFINFF